MAERQNKAMRVSVGILLMAAFVLIVFGILTRFAGTWGVPYFSFISERGSPCVNKLTGYVCEPLTLADLQFYGDVTLPADTTVVRGTYTATHDYLLQAKLEVPKGSAAPALAALADEFGRCVPGHPVPNEIAQLGSICVLANADAVNREGEPPSRLYVIGTGIRAEDGVRVIDLTIRSR